jgi:hypothetical protein
LRPTRSELVTPRGWENNNATFTPLSLASSGTTKYFRSSFPQCLPPYLVLHPCFHCSTFHTFIDFLSSCLRSIPEEEEEEVVWTGKVLRITLAVLEVVGMLRGVDASGAVVVAVVVVVDGSLRL